MAAGLLGTVLTSKSSMIMSIGQQNTFWKIKMMWQSTLSVSGPSANLFFTAMVL
jgi:hypothetical protein